MPKLKLYKDSRELIRQVNSGLVIHGKSCAVIDVDSVILSKCHSGESLFEYYLQEFQYGNNVFQTTTNK